MQKVISPICPICKSGANCYWRNVGGKDYDDEFTLFCPKCSHIERKIKYGGSPFAEERITVCPFCGKPFDAHETTPPELCDFPQGGGVNV